MLQQMAAASVKQRFEHYQQMASTQESTTSETPTPNA
jgi:hypothetical protein